MCFDCPPLDALYSRVSVSKMPELSHARPDLCDTLPPVFPGMMSLTFVPVFCLGERYG